MGLWSWRVSSQTLHQLWRRKAAWTREPTMAPLVGFGTWSNGVMILNLTSRQGLAATRSAHLGLVILHNPKERKRGKQTV